MRARKNFILIMWWEGNRIKRRLEDYWFGTFGSSIEVGRVGEGGERERGG